MRLFRVAAVFCVALIVAGPSNAQDAAKKKKKGVLKGQVVEVQQDPAAKDKATITVKTVLKKQGTTQESKIHITDKTKLEKVTGKKGEKKHTEATLAALQKGQTVLIHTRTGQPQEAERVEIITKKKNKAIG
jgi:hypothetical protein